MAVTNKLKQLTQIATTSSSATEKPTKDTGLDLVTYFILLGAITFVFFAVLICITLYSYYVRKRKKKLSAKQKMDEKYVVHDFSNLRSAFDESNLAKSKWNAKNAGSQNKTVKSPYDESATITSWPVTIDDLSNSKTKSAKSTKRSAVISKSKSPKSKSVA